MERETLYRNNHELCVADYFNPGSTLSETYNIQNCNEENFNPGEFDEQNLHPPHPNTGRRDTKVLFVWSLVGDRVAWTNPSGAGITHEAFLQQRRNDEHNLHMWSDLGETITWFDISVTILNQATATHRSHWNRVWSSLGRRIGLRNDHEFQRYNLQQNSTDFQYIFPLHGHDLGAVIIDRTRLTDENSQEGSSPNSRIAT